LADSPLEKLRDIVYKGIAIDVFNAEQAFFLDEFTGKNALEINEASFGAFFGTLQAMLGRELILATTRIFEAANPRYPIRSIPSALKTLNEFADEIAITDRKILIEWLSRKDAILDGKSIQLTDAKLNHLFVQTCNSFLPSLSNAENALSSPLTKLKAVRDKRIAHHESVEKDISVATYAEIQHLLEAAKEFLAIVGPAYLSIIYQFDDGNHPLTSDAKRATICLKRLLRKSDIL